MNNSSLYYPLIDDTVRMVSIVFPESFHAPMDGMKKYSYKCDFNVSKGDFVVAETRGFLSVGCVVEVDVPLPIESDASYRWIVDVVSIDAHKERLEFEKEIMKSVTKLRAKNMRQSMMHAMGLTDEGIKSLKALVRPDTVDGQDEVIEDFDEGADDEAAMRFVRGQ